MASPLVSVVTPAFNMAPFIGEAVRSALNQTYRNIELIVVDDGSTDGTRTIVEDIAKSDPRVSLRCQVNLGVAAARNHAISCSSGEYVAPLDADDVWYPEKLEKQVDRMRGQDSAGLVYGWHRQIDAAGEVIRDGPKWHVEGRVYDALALRNFVSGGSMPLMKRSCIDRVGGYGVWMREMGAQGCEDWDLYLRIAARHDFLVVPEYLVGYRRHPASMSSNRSAMARSRRLVVQQIGAGDTRVPRRVLRWVKAKQRVYEIRGLHGGEYWRVLALALSAFRFDPIGLLAFVAGRVGGALDDRGERQQAAAAAIPPTRVSPYDVLCAKRLEWIVNRGATPSGGRPTVASASASVDIIEGPSGELP